MTTKQQIEFTESQSQKGWVMWIIMIFLCLLFVYGFISQIILEKPFGNNPMSDTMLIVVLILMFALSIGLLTVKLKTHINKEGVFVRFTLFQPACKFYDWQAVESWEVKQYNPLGRYGGWGYRRAFVKKKVAYSMYGRWGLELNFIDGRQVVIGTQQKEEMERLLNQLQAERKKKNGERK